MYRCLSVVLCSASMLAAFAVAPAVAQVQRNFPRNALRGAMVVTAPPQVMLNGQAAQLSPGARIRNPDNMQQLSASLVGQKLLVNYTIDELGQVSAVWVLTPVEAAVRWPETPRQAAAWVFDPVAQAWSKP